MSTEVLQLKDQSGEKYLCLEIRNVGKALQRRLQDVKEEKCIDKLVSDRENLITEDATSEI